MSEIAKKIVLNAGAGASRQAQLPGVFNPKNWVEIRLDIDPAAQPDLLGSFVNMGGKIGDKAVDAVFCSHAIEHLYAHEVIPALREFLRILKPDGFALVTCPDLAAVARHMLAHGAESVIYQSAAGPIRAVDMIFGHSKSIADGRASMAHHTGFTGQRLARVAMAAGFPEVRMIEGGSLDLWGLLLGPAANHAKIAPIFAGSDLARLIDVPAYERLSEIAAAVEAVRPRTSV